MTHDNRLHPDVEARLRSLLAGRGLAPMQPQADSGGDPNEPGHPEYHRRRRIEIAMTRWEQLTPPRYQTATATEPDVVAWADAVVDNPAAAGSLLLAGTTGTGKTHQAYGALRRIAQAGPTNFAAISVNAADMYGELRPSGTIGDSEARLRQLRSVPLLHIDDLCAAKGSAWVEEVTYRLINSRYNDLLPTVITTNSPPAQLSEELGDRIASRLAGMCRIVAMVGQDRRRPAK